MAVQRDKKTAEMNLLKSLKSLPFNASGSEIHEVEAIISQKFKSIGWNFLGGVTQPYFGPYIYEKLEEKIYSVELPDGNRNLPVKLMRKFHSLSWLDYATFGICGTGGWAKQDGLYCDQVSGCLLYSEGSPGAFPGRRSPLPKVAWLLV